MKTKKHILERTTKLGGWGLSRLAFLTCLFVFLSRPVLAGELPRAQLDESERHFTEAYMRFLNRDYWGASSYLDRALKANTYLVDYYLMKGLAMDRTGDYVSGREALVYYLEVRPLDITAPRILSHAIAQQRDLRRLLGTSALSVRWQISPLDLQMELGMGTFRPFSVVGMGKAKAWGSVLCVADTLGNKVAYVKKSSGKASDFVLDAPIAPLPLGDGTFYAVTVSGDVYAFDALSNAPASPDLKGTLDVAGVVADAAALSGGELVVADPVARQMAFYSLTTSANTGVWAPPEEEGAMLFEPVALAAYGPWLAVADRGNGKIFFLNGANRRDFFSVNMPRPRDVAWSPIGELFVINEDGNLYRIPADFRDRKTGTPDLMESGLAEGWTLFAAPGGDLYCMDISASRLWKAVPVPDVDISSGFLSLSHPKVEREENKESFVLEAILSSPFVTYAKKTVPVVYSVWNNRSISSAAAWLDEPKKAEVLVFHRPASPGMVYPALQNRVAENGTDIQLALPALWSTQRTSLTNIVVDSSIIFSPDELDALTLFCLNNGLELDVWARSIPSVELTRASALTGGKTLLSMTNAPDLNPPRNKMQVRIPLPQELSSSGYPSRSMLTVFLDVGMMHTKDWIPLWPDLLE
ncbi:MAG: hypothetical protein LBD04_06640 [Synergistaceae bacterium]|jgi:hypothetical protein|nr:hypothetical protein [Synergistaceae bacterium]